MSKKSKALARRLEQISLPPGSDSETGLPFEIAVGDIFADKHDGFVKVVRLLRRKKDDPDADVMVYYIDVDRQGRPDPDERGYNHSCTLREFRYYGYLRVTWPLEELLAEAEKAIADPAAYLDEGETSTETGLIVSGGKARAEAAQSAIAERRRKVEIISRIAESKMRAFQHKAYELRKQLANIHKIIQVIELYLGVYETVTLIRDGAAAAPATPLTLRQQVLYMDEECGDPREKAGGQRGIDFNSVPEFDAWLTGDPARLDRFLPETRGIVAIKPSRQNREYAKGDPLVDAMINLNNKMTYLLCRNGERVYRIWTNIAMGERLFPAMDELETKEDYWHNRDLEEKTFDYRRNMMIIQGLLDRSDIFHPLAAMINLGDQETYEGAVILIRDDEAALSDGRLTYQEWKAQVNASIRRGSRVLISGDILSGRRYSYYSSDFFRGRMTRYYSRNANTPPWPKTGIYEVDTYDTTTGYGDKRKAVTKLIIRYNPGDEIGFSGWTYDPHQRKNRVSFIIHPDEDSFVLNYDNIGLADVEFYINSRNERRDYLDIIPTLWGIREERLKELEWERHFVNLIADRTGQAENAVWEAVAWWKHKNIWQRPIRQDDAKALRMIERRLLRQTTEEGDEDAA